MLLRPVWTWEANPRLHQIDPDGTPVSVTNVGITLTATIIRPTGEADLRFGMTTSGSTRK